MKPKLFLLTLGPSFAAVASALAQTAITTQPQDRTNYVGTTATFTVVTTGTNPVSYQWQKYSADFADLAGRTNAVLTLANVQTNDAADYRVVVTDATGTTNSAAAHLFVVLPETLFISQPAPRLVTLSWQGNMVLLQAGSIDCPAWIRVAGASSVTLPVGSGSQFFRLVALPSAAELQAAFTTNLERCEAFDGASYCEDCVAAYLLKPPQCPLGGLFGDASEAASLGIGLGSCVSAAQQEVLRQLSIRCYGP